MLTGVFGLVLALAFSARGAGAADWPDLEPSARSPAPEGSKDAAIVIAIEDYLLAPDIPGALSNGRAWHNWLVDTRRVPSVKTLFNEQATKEEMLQSVAQVAALVRPGGSLWVVYIGHGAPSEGTGDGLLVGVDAQQTPTSLAARGLPRGELLAAAEAVLPGGAQVVMVQDACFSGSTPSGDLAPGMAPLKVVKAGLGGNTTVLAAAKGNQYAGPLSDSSRPAFSYLVLGALRGWGDENQDGAVTAAEAVGYATRAMVTTIHGRSQTPELEGHDLALCRSPKEKAPDLAAFSRVGTGASARSPAPAPSPTPGEGSSFAVLAAQVAAAQAAREQADAATRALTEQLEADRKARIAHATTEFQLAAKRDFEAITPLVNTPTREAEAVLVAWIARYGQASVEVDGQQVPVVVAEAPRVEAAIKKLEREAGRDGDRAPSPIAPTASTMSTTNQPARADGVPVPAAAIEPRAPAAAPSCALPTRLEAHTKNPLALKGAGDDFDLLLPNGRKRFRSALVDCGLDAAIGHFDRWDDTWDKPLYYFILMLEALEAEGHSILWPGAGALHSPTMATSLRKMCKIQRLGCPPAAR